MDVQRRKFSTEQKMKILQQARNNGITRILQEHKLSYSVFARWKKQLEIETNGSVRQILHSHDLENLETENLRLIKIVANSVWNWK
jgi:putative transposase